MKRVEYIFGAGKAFPKKEGRINVDRLNMPNIDVVWNLEKFNYPLESSSGLHINCSHVIEHLNPASLPGFFDECHRILNPGGTLYIETPHAANINLAFSDPTHYRAFTKHSFINYLTIEGVKRFGYMKHAWCILHISPRWEEVPKDGNLIVHMMPIPDEMTDDEILNRLTQKEPAK